MHSSTFEIVYLYMTTNFEDCTKGLNLPTNLHQSLFKATLQDCGKGFEQMSVGFYESGELSPEVLNEWKWLENKWVNYLKAAKKQSKLINKQMREMRKAIEQLAQHNAPDIFTAEYLKTAFDLTAFGKELECRTKELVNAGKNFDVLFENSSQIKVLSRQHYKREKDGWKPHENEHDGNKMPYFCITMPFELKKNIVAVHFYRKTMIGAASAQISYWKNHKGAWSQLIWQVYRNS